MTTITIYGGCGEIGGNQILMSHADTNILLDFGTRMGFDSTFFAEFLDVRTNTALRDSITIGSIPRIPGIYRDDHVRPAGMEDIDTEFARVLTPDSPYLRLEGLETYEEYRTKHGRPAVDALFVTHAHLDHTGAIGFLHPEIPLYCSGDSEILIRSIDDVTAFTSDALESGMPAVKLRKSGKYPGAPFLDKKEKVTRPCHVLTDSEAVEIGDMKVTLIEVDHSVPGAASYIVEAGGKRILYTGDIRFHGTRPMSISEYIDKLGGPVDVMLCEGTRVGSGRVMTESEIGEKILARIRETEGLVFIDFSWKDTTRYETIRDACEKAGRTFVINARLAYILKQFDNYPGEDTNVRVLLKRKGSSLYSPADYPLHEYGLSVDKENIDDTHYRSGVTADDIRADPAKYVLMMSFFDLGQMFDIADSSGQVPNSHFIKAQCAPFSDEMEIDEERMITWLEKFDIDFDEAVSPLPEGCATPGCEKLYRHIDRSHVSGHASRPELKELITKIAPKKLIPLHTEDPGAFKKLVEEIQAESGVSIELVEVERGQVVNI